MLDSSVIVQSDSPACEFRGKEAYAFSVSRLEFLDDARTKLQLHFDFQVGCAGIETTIIDLP